MKHINELIGILEGAIFDDIINSNEVDCIKNGLIKIEILLMIHCILN